MKAKKIRGSVYRIGTGFKRSANKTFEKRRTHKLMRRILGLMADPDYLKGVVPIPLTPELKAWSAHLDSILDAMPRMKIPKEAIAVAAQNLADAADEWALRKVYEDLKK